MPSWPTMAMTQKPRMHSAMALRRRARQSRRGMSTTRLTVASGTITEEGAAHPRPPVQRRHEHDAVDDRERDDHGEERDLGDKQLAVPRVENRIEVAYRGRGVGDARE